MMKTIPICMGAMFSMSWLICVIGLLLQTHTLLRCQRQGGCFKLAFNSLECSRHQRENFQCHIYPMWSCLQARAIAAVCTQLIKPQEHNFLLSFGPAEIDIILFSTCANIQDGTPIDRWRRRQVNQEPNANADRVNINVRQPRTCEIYYIGCQGID